MQVNFFALKSYKYSFKK